MIRILVVSLEEVIESRQESLLDGHHDWREIEKATELNDIIAMLPKKIHDLGQRRADGYALTNTERKQLERFNKSNKGQEILKLMKS